MTAICSVMMLQEECEAVMAYLDVVGGAVAGAQGPPLGPKAIPHLQVVALDCAASVVGGAVPRQGQGGAPHI
jgi:hypothetical protein